MINKRGLFKGFLGAAVAPAVANNLAVGQMYPQAALGVFAGFTSGGDTATGGLAIRDYVPAGSNCPTCFKPRALDGDNRIDETEDYYLLTDFGPAI